MIRLQFLLRILFYDFDFAPGKIIFQAFSLHDKMQTRISPINTNSICAALQPEGLPEGSRGLSKAKPPDRREKMKHPERVQENWQCEFLRPLQGRFHFSSQPEVSAGAPTSGYLLANLRLASNARRN
jgi:hypothetical protein